MARLEIGVAVSGQIQVDKLATSLSNADKALYSWLQTSKAFGSNTDRTVRAVSLLDSEFKKLAAQAQASAASLTAFFQGPKASATAAIYGQAEAVQALATEYNQLIAVHAKQELLGNAGVARLREERAAIEANMAAYKRLQQVGEVGAAYNKAIDYSKLEERYARENFLIESRVAHLKDLEAEERKLQRIQNEAIASQMEERYAKENALIESRVAHLKDLEAEERKLQRIQNEAIASQMAERYRQEDAAIERHVVKLKEAEAAEIRYQYQRNKAIADQMAERFAKEDAVRAKLAAGASAGGYDYAEQMRKEEALYDSVTGKLKEQWFILGDLGGAWGKAAESGKIFHSVLRGTSGALGSLWLSYGRGAKEILAIASAFAAVSTTIKSVQIAAVFDDTIRRVQVLSDEGFKGAEGLVAIREAILSIEGVAAVPTELAAGLLEMARAGIDVKESLVDLAEVARFASLSGIEMGKAMELLIGQSRAFTDVSISDAANIIAKVADYTSVSIEQMTEALKHTTELGTVLGIKFRDLATALGVIADRGIRGSAAGTSLRTSLLHLVAPTNAATEVMKKYLVNFSAIDESTGKVKDLHTVIKDLSVATKHLTPGELTVVLSKLSDSRSIKAIGALLDAVRDEEKVFEDGTEAIKQHNIAYSELYKESEKALGSASYISYLQKQEKILADSGIEQLKRLSAAFEKLSIRSVDVKKVADSMKELREVIDSKTTRESLTFIVDKLTDLAKLSIKGINIVVKYLEEGDEAGPFEKTGRQFGGVVGAAGGLAVSGYTEGIIPAWMTVPIGAGAGYYGGGEVGKEIDKFAGTDPRINTNLERAVQELNRLYKEFSNAQENLSKVIRRGAKEGSKTYNNYVNEVDKASKAVQSQLEIVNRLESEQNKKVGGSVEVNDEKLLAIKAAEESVARIKNLITTGKTPEGFFFDDQSINQLNTRLKEAETMLTGLKDGTVSAETAMKFFGESGAKSAGAVTAEIALMNEELKGGNLTNLQKLEAEFSKARDDIFRSMMSPEHANYEKREEWETVSQWTARLNSIADQWLDAHKKIRAADISKAVALDLKPANDSIKQMASNNAAMEATFEKEKRALELTNIDNEKAYATGLKSFNDYLYSKNEIQKKALEQELIVKEAAAKAAQEEFSRFTEGIEGYVQGDELVGKQIDLQRNLNEANKDLATVKGKILELDRASYLLDKEKVDYSVSLINAEAQLLSLQAGIRRDKELQQKADLKQLEAEEASLAYGDAAINQYKRQAIELKKLQVVGLSVTDSIIAGFRAAEYTNKEFSDDISAVTIRAFEGMTDALTEFVMTGKMSFSDLANSIIRDLIRIQIQQSVTGPLSGWIGTVVGTSAGAIGGGASATGPGYSVPGVTPGFHSGGIVGSDSPTFTRNVHPSTFVSAPRFHSGLTPDEFPAILKKGEGVFTPAQMAALGGRSKGVKVTVHNYGTDVKVEQVSQDEIRIIAREEAKSAVYKHGPSMMTSTISNPNSHFSKALGSQTTTSRKRL